MILLLFSLLTKYEKKIVHDPIERFGRFNFNSGGTFNFEIESEEDQDVQFAFFSEKQIPYLENYENSKKSLCSVPLENRSIQNFIIHIVNGTGNFSGNFSEFYVSIAAGSRCNNSDTPISITATYQNRKYNLSSDVYPVIYLKAVLFCFYFVLIVLWITFFFVQRQRMGFIWILMTVTLSFFFLDNLMFFLLLHHFSHSEKSTFVTYIRYVTRGISIMLFYATIVLSAFTVSRDGKRVTRDNLIASFATGFFIAIPITCSESINKTDSELWINYLATVLLFICWGISFQLLNKAWNPIFHQFQDLLSRGKDASQTPLGKQYRALNMHTILYAIVLFTTINYILIPYPMKYAFILSQLLFDTSMFGELLVSILFFWVLKMVFGVDESEVVSNISGVGDDGMNSELQTHLITDDNISSFHEGENTPESQTLLASDNNNEDPQGVYLQSLDK